MTEAKWRADGNSHWWLNDGSPDILCNYLSPRLSFFFPVCVVGYRSSYGAISCAVWTWTASRFPLVAFYGNNLFPIVAHFKNNLYRCHLIDSTLLTTETSYNCRDTACALLLSSQHSGLDLHQGQMTYAHFGAWCSFIKWDENAERSSSRWALGAGGECWMQSASSFLCTTEISLREMSSTGTSTD